ncbi:hypothetical protein [Bacillus cereus]|nr:hypothetical protein [Bacillus cereus]
MAPCQYLFEFCAGDCGNGKQLKWKKYVCDDGNKDVYVGCC